MGVESYKHKFAKTVLVSWLREIAGAKSADAVKLEPLSWRVNRGGPHFGVWEEYPFAIDSENRLWGDSLVWDETGDWGDAPGGSHPDFKWTLRPPTYDELIAMKLLPVCIFDVAIQHKGSIIYGIEVVHRNPVSAEKVAYFKRIHAEVYEISADWILSRVHRPARLEMIKIFGG